MLTVGLAIALPLAMVACGTDDGGGDTATADAGSSPSSAADDLAGTSWVLSGIQVPQDDGTDSATGVVAGRDAPTLTFAADGQGFGSTGCNRFTATWSQDGGSVAIEVGAVTQAACAGEELNRQEADYLRLLDAVDTVETSEDTLRLTAGEDGALEFDAALSDLAGTAWQATGVNNQTGGVESTELTTSITAEFADDGTVSGFSGCRGYTGSYEAADGSLSVTDISLDGPECSGDEAELEASYVAALQNASTFAIEGSTLNLRDSEGATQVNYALRP